MSLINDVLRNLEANRPDDLAGHKLQREIRSLPAAVPARRGFRLILLAALALALAVAAWQWQQRLAALPAVPAPAVAPVAPPPVAQLPAAVMPVLPPPPVPTLTLADDLLTVAPTAAVPVPPPALGAPAALDAPPAAAPALSAAPAIAGPLVEAPRLLPAPSAVAVAATAVTVAVPVKIEKSPVLATPQDRADADWRRAEAALAAGRGDEAREALRAALRHEPNHLQARQSLLRQLLAARQIDAALAVLQEGLDLQPAQTGWAMSLARLQFEQGDIAAADSSLARAQAYAENNADYAGFQGHLKTRLGAHRQAAAHYQRATRLAPNDGRWWLGLGLALESDGRLPESREALRRALAVGNLPGELAAVAEQHLR